MRAKYAKLIEAVDLLMNHELVNLAALYKRATTSIIRETHACGLTQYDEIRLWHFFDDGGMSVKNIIKRIGFPHGIDENKKTQKLKVTEKLPNDRDDSL